MQEAEPSTDLWGQRVGKAKDMSGPGGRHVKEQKTSPSLCISPHPIHEELQRALGIFT